MTSESSLRTAAALAAVFGASACVAAVMWRLAKSRMQRDRWLRANYRGEHVVAMTGIVVVVIGVLSAAVVAALALPSMSSGGWFVYAPSSAVQPDQAARSFAAGEGTGAVATVLLIATFGWLGYRDDTRDNGAPGGFIAHLTRSWQQRRPTSGVQKALGGGIAAILCVQMVLFGSVSSLFSADGWTDGFTLLQSFRELVIESPHNWSVVALLRGALIVTLGANLLNLFDRMPGRATKVALAWWLVGLVPAGLANAEWPPGLELAGAPTGWFAWHSPTLWATGAVGASIGLLGSEMREEHMQGDTGVNATGAALGLATVGLASASVEWVVLAILAVFNIASERWSFSQIIDSVPPLRWLDRLGSPHRRD